MLLTLSIPLSPGSVGVALEGKLAEAEESLRSEVAEKTELRAMLGRAAQELQVPVRPGASMALQVGHLMSSGREWVRRGVRFGMRTVFAVLGMHFMEMDYEVPSLGYLNDTPEEMARIRTDSKPHADVLAAKYEEELDYGKVVVVAVSH